MDKKKIFAIVLFLVMSLFLFSFANPEDLEFVEFEEDTPIVEPVVEEEPVIEEPIVEPVVEESQQVLTPARNNRASNTRRSSNSNNTNTSTNNTNTTSVEPEVVKPNPPVLKVTPERVVILLGQDYNLMTGVEIDSSESLSVSSNITNINNLGIGTHEIIYSVTDSYNQNSSAKRTVVILDPKSDEDKDGYANQEEYDNDYSYEDENNHPNEPTLNLKGDNPLIVLKNHIYVEPGYLYTVDPTDEETKEVTIIGEVNTEVLGDYTLTYKLVDKYGKSVEKTRLVLVKEDINNNNVDDEQDDKFTVKFYDFNKKIVKEETVLVGMDATAPELENIQNYIFIGWDKEYSNIEKDLDIYAVYAEDINGNGIADSQDEIYNVKFYNIDNELVKEENVLVGMDATAPTLEPVDKKIFLNWDTDYTNVEKDLNVYPVYGDDVNNNGILDEEDTLYIVKFYDFNQTLVKEERVLVGTSATPPVLPKVTNYIFLRWDTDYTNVEKDLNIYPVYGDDKNNNDVLDENDTRYTVKFYNKANEVVKEEQVLIGMDASAPELESIPNYIFNGWNIDYTNVQEELDVYPLYLDDMNNNDIDDTTEQHYTVVFKTNEHGYLSRIGLENEREIKYENILTGLTFEEAGIVVPTVHESEGFYYVSWDKELNTTVNDNITYNAVYTYQNGIMAVKKDANTNLTFQINSDESAIYDNILVYKTFEGNLKEEELTTEYTTDFKTNKKGTKTLTVTQGEFSDKSLKYEIIEETAYSTKFSIKYNTSKSYDRCSSNWDRNCTRIIHQPVDYNFLEITESYIGIVIDLKSAVVEYTDETKDIFLSDDFGLIRWESTRPNGNKRFPTYKTPALNDEGKTIKYVTINFTKNNKKYYIKFEYKNEEFVAIDGNEN